MNEIKKLEYKVKNAKIQKSPELRMTIDDASALLDEILAIKDPVPEIRYVVEKTDISYSTMDGGSF